MNTPRPLQCEELRILDKVDLEDEVPGARLRVELVATGERLGVVLEQLEVSRMFPEHVIGRVQIDEARVDDVLAAIARVRRMAPRGDA